MGSTFRDDVRFAWRRLRKRPLGALGSVVTLAWAIGAAAVTWSLLSALLLHPLPVEAPDRLVAVGARFAAPDGQPAWVSSHFLYPQYREITESGVFAGIAAGGALDLVVGHGEGAVPRPRTVFFASHDYFDTLGVRLQAGRDFTADDDSRGAPVTAVVSDRFWRSALNADPGVVGRELVFPTQATMTAASVTVHATIVGVAPPGFRGLDLARAPDVYLPLHAIAVVAPGFPNPLFDPDADSSPSSWIAVTGRLKDGGTPDDVATQLARLDLGRDVTFDLTPANTAAVPEPARAGMVQFTQLLSTTVGLLLVIGCLTVGMLLLLRTEARRDELAMCLALGGTRLSLVRGIVLEGAMLASAGALLAIPVAAWLMSGARTFELPGGVDLEMLGLAVDRRVWTAVAFGAVGATLLAALVAGAFGFAPRIADVLRARAGGTPRVTRRRTRAALVIAQVAVTLVLLAGAGLFSRSLAAALTLNTGFDASRVVTGALPLDRYGYTAASAVPFFTAFRDRVAGAPDIESLSLIQREGGMTPSGRIPVNGDPRGFPVTVAYIAVDEHYFSTMGMRILKGRDFAASDTASSPLVVIVSESLARELSPGGDPLRLRLTETSWRPPDPPGVAEVIGVVPDVITNVTVTEPLVIYYSLAQREPTARRAIVARARSDAAIAGVALARTIRQLDAGIEPGPIISIEEQLARQMSPQRMGIFVLGSLGVVAILLTLLGTYVTAESMASTRTRELSIPATLGARRAQLGGLVLLETLRLVGAGVISGLALAWLGAGTIRAFLFRVEPLDILTLSAVALSIVALALLVSLRPALSAARVDLAHVLRDE